jgi:Transglutaminase-like superfamily
MVRLIGLASLLTVLLHAGSVSAQPGTDRQLLETWDAVYLEGAKAGHVHTIAKESMQGDLKLVRTKVDLQLLVKRFKQVIQLRQETGDDALPDGHILGTFMRQNVGRNKELLIVGMVKDNQLDLTLDGKADVLKPAPWDDAAVGLFRQQSLWADRKVTPNSTFSYMAFEPTVNLLVRKDVAVKDLEEIDLPPSREKLRLLRVEMLPQKLEGLQLPKVTTWLDEAMRVRRQDTELPGLGRITLVRTTKEIALAPGGAAAPVDVGIAQVIRLNKKIVNPHEKSAVVFRMTVQGEEDASQTIVHNTRQQVTKTMGAAFEVQLLPSRGPALGQAAADASPAECLESNYYITAADAKVRELARKAVGKESDPWRKALAIEKWVHRNMRGTNAEALVPADQVARTLEGDCTEYAMLAAAMCRAEGVPSKTAIGLVYQDSKVGPAMVFHMWTEVWVAGQWLAIDSTLGRGGIGPTHLKVTDHTWHDTRSLTPLLPLTRIVGKTQLEVVSVR